ncbi:hypothetical protein D3C72_1239100 [compost metagenome]
MKSFSAEILKTGINPYVEVPDKVVQTVLKQAGREKGPVPVRGSLGGKPFKHTLLKFQGKWTLYLNAGMRVAAGIDVGDIAKVRMEYDPQSRVESIHPGLRSALEKSKKAAVAFAKLSVSHQGQISRYLKRLKSSESLERNIQVVLAHLKGESPKTLGPLMRR